MNKLFSTNVPFLCPLKTSEKTISLTEIDVALKVTLISTNEIAFSDVFRGHRNAMLA